MLEKLELDDEGKCFYLCFALLAYFICSLQVYGLWLNLIFRLFLKICLLFVWFYIMGIIPNIICFKN